MHARSIAVRAAVVVSAGVVAVGAGTSGPSSETVAQAAQKGHHAKQKPRSVGKRHGKAKRRMCRYNVRTKSGHYRPVKRRCRGKRATAAPLAVGAVPGPSNGPFVPVADVLTPITGRRFYVSPSGSDSNSGSSPSSAWRSVGKANTAPVSPGDGVLFEAGHAYTDQALSPTRGGTAASRVVYGAYGSGKASLPKGIYLNGVSGLAFQNLEITGPAQAILATASGQGSRDITLESLSVHDVSVAVNSANWGDVRWTIRNNQIDRTGDSGMILLGTDFQITGNHVLDTGRDKAISYGKHGIYLKVIGARVAENTIRRFTGNGVSVRYRNSLVERNTIADGPIGIAWFQQDTVAGASTWRQNTITGTTAAGIYVSPSDEGGQTRESFTITGNRLQRTGGVATDLKNTAGRYTVAENAS